MQKCAFYEMQQKSGLTTNLSLLQKGSVLPSRLKVELIAAHEHFGQLERDDSECTLNGSAHERQMCGESFATAPSPSVLGW